MPRSISLAWVIGTVAIVDSGLGIRGGVYLSPQRLALPLPPQSLAASYRHEGRADVAGYFAAIIVGLFEAPMQSKSITESLTL
jgi:hypothetical protein